ncbi:hypothetical protein Lepto7376_3598 [[Leptolyngbya] sp. PCC 7376]|uniref:hypothetical protein n=1 Tax=[Leptolyngbya] sp. PCC 7376 TaxID=111781 RepID=UPI00029F4371|nr:hypothetical protein [[Leptolyngbya] sp. PCC 7376]AFY39784.1 hypothetical protein Lepto7376_3598 [[Leptolyngbya] sp. PCC 7376]
MKNNQLFKPIENRSEAIKVIKDISYVFFFIAGLQAILGFFISPIAVLDGIIYAVLAGLLLTTKSRIVAILLLLLSVISVISTCLNALGISEGGTNIVLSFIIFYSSIRALHATFVLQGASSTENNADKTKELNQ